eukprot:scaffold1333_cov274-Prasinococcus_capsulatus_cf.AAC.2
MHQTCPRVLAPNRPWASHEQEPHTATSRPAACSPLKAVCGPSYGLYTRHPPVASLHAWHTPC